MYAQTGLMWTGLLFIYQNVRLSKRTIGMLYQALSSLPYKTLIHFKIEHFSCHALSILLFPLNKNVQLYRIKVL